MARSIVDDVDSIREAMQRLQQAKQPNRPTFPVDDANFAINDFIQRWYRAEVIVNSPYWHLSDAERVPAEFRVEPPSPTAEAYLRYLDRVQAGPYWSMAIKLAYLSAKVGNHRAENTKLVLIRLRALQLL